MQNIAERIKRDDVFYENLLGKNYKEYVAWPRIYIKDLSEEDKKKWEYWAKKLYFIKLFNDEFYSLNHCAFSAADEEFGYWNKIGHDKSWKDEAHQVSDYDEIDGMIEDSFSQLGDIFAFQYFLMQFIPANNLIHEKEIKLSAWNTSLVFLGPNDSNKYIYISESLLWIQDSMERDYKKIIENPDIEKINEFVKKIEEKEKLEKVIGDYIKVREKDIPQDIDTPPLKNIYLWINDKKIMRIFELCLRNPEKRKIFSLSKAIEKIRNKSSRQDRYSFVFIDTRSTGGILRKAACSEYKKNDEENFCTLVESIDGNFYQYGGGMPFCLTNSWTEDSAFYVNREIKRNSEEWKRLGNNPNISVCLQCSVPPFNEEYFSIKTVGNVKTAEFEATIEIDTCNSCHRKWLIYSADKKLENETLKSDIADDEKKLRSSRWLKKYYEINAPYKTDIWFKGIITEEIEKTVKPENALKILEKLAWYFRGGGCLNWRIEKISGKKINFEDFRNHQDFFKLEVQEYIKKKQSSIHLNAISEYLNTSFPFITIPSGSFDMGSNDYDNEKPIHRVSISAFKMSKYEVTQKLWKLVMNTEPWKGQNNVQENDNNAASYISYNDAVLFCAVLSELLDESYRLPTEAEWEYACRAGTTTKYYWGDAMDGEYCWYSENANNIEEKYAHTVGQKKANAFGLYDMSGNVWEWCSDWYQADYYLNSPTTNPKGSNSGLACVIRGGSWFLNAECCRSASRFGSNPSNRFYDDGFRLVLTSGQQ